MNLNQIFYYKNDLCGSDFKTWFFFRKIKANFHFKNYSRSPPTPSSKIFHLDYWLSSILHEGNIWHQLLTNVHLIYYTIPSALSANGVWRRNKKILAIKFISTFLFFCFNFLLLPLLFRFHLLMAFLWFTITERTKGTWVEKVSFFCFIFLKKLYTTIRKSWNSVESMKWASK